MAAVIERMAEALNRHNLEAFLECFDPNYRSEQPAHPNRGFGGKEQVRKNWSGMFESFPDFEAQLLRHTAEGGVVWSEWHWSARGPNMAGVTIFVLLRPDGGFSIEGNLDAAVVRYTEEVAEYAERLEKADERIRNARPEGKAASLDRVERELARVREESTRRRGARP